MTSRSVDDGAGYGTASTKANSGRNTITIELPADIEGVTFSVEPKPALVPLPLNEEMR